MRNEHELRLHSHFFYQFSEAPNVRLIQRRIHFIQNAERAGLILKDTN